MVKKSPLFPRFFFDVISLAKNLSMGKTSMGKTPTSFLVKMKVNENIRGGLILFVTLKS